MPTYYHCHGMVGVHSIIAYDCFAFQNKFLNNLTAIRYCQIIKFKRIFIRDESIFIDWFWDQKWNKTFCFHHFHVHIDNEYVSSKLYLNFPLQIFGENYSLSELWCNTHTKFTQMNEKCEKSILWMEKRKRKNQTFKKLTPKWGD